NGRGRYGPAARPSSSSRIRSVQRSWNAAISPGSSIAFCGQHSRMVTSLAIMKFGLYGLHKGENTAADAFVRRARLAEDAGFESIWVGDHIALPLDAPDDAYEARLEAVVALAHLAAV